MGNRSLLSKKELAMEPTYYKRRTSWENEESLFGPPIKRVVQDISSSDDSSSESDSSEPNSN